MELFAVFVVPDLLGLVLSLEIHSAGIPVVFLPRNVAAAFQEQNALAGGSQLMRQGAAAGAGADNDDIEMVLRGHIFTPFRQRLVVLPRLYGGTVTKIIGYPFAAWLARSFEPRVAAPKLTPKRAHQMLTDLYLSRSASAGTS